MGLLDTLLGRTKPVRANLDALFALPSAAVTLQVTSGLTSTGRAGVCFKPPSGQSFSDMQAELEKMLELGDVTNPAPSPAAPASPTAPAAAASPTAPAVPAAPASPTTPPAATGPTTPAAATGPDTPAAATPTEAASLTVRHVGDRFGYRWILVEGGGLEDLVTRVHMVHSTLEDAGWSPQLLCSVFGFAPDEAAAATGEAVTKPIFLVYLAKQGTFYPFAPVGEEKRDTELELRLRGVLGNDLPVEADLSRWFPLWDLPVA